MLDPFCIFPRSMRQQRPSPVNCGRASVSEADRPPADAMHASPACHLAKDQFESAPPRRTAAEVQARTLHTGWRSSAGCVPLKSRCYSAAHSPSKLAAIRRQHSPLAMPRAVSDSALCGPVLVEVAESDCSARSSEAGERQSMDSNSSGIVERSSICFATLARQLSHGNLLSRYGSRGSIDGGRPSLGQGRPSLDEGRCSSNEGRSSLDEGRSSFDGLSGSDASERSEGASYALPSPQQCEGAALPQQRAPGSPLPPPPVSGEQSALRVRVGDCRHSIDGLSEQSSDGGKARLRHVSSASAFPQSQAPRVAMDADCCGDSGAVVVLRRSFSHRTSSDAMCSESEVEDSPCAVASPGTLPSTRRDSFPLALHERKTVRPRLDVLIVSSHARVRDPGALDPSPDACTCARGASHRNAAPLGALGAFWSAVCRPSHTPCRGGPFCSHRRRRSTRGA